MYTVFHHKVDCERTPFIYEPVKIPIKKVGIFGILEYLIVLALVLAYDSTIGPHNIYTWEKYPRGTCTSSWPTKYKKFARFQPYMVISLSFGTIALNDIA